MKAQQREPAFAAVTDFEKPSTVRISPYDNVGLAANLSRHPTGGIGDIRQRDSSA